MQINLESAYRATRGNRTTATARLAIARKRLARFESLAMEYEISCATRPALADVSKARALVSYYGDSGFYVGTWQPGKPGMFYSEKPDSLFRGIWTSEETGAVKHSGWYDNEHGESARDGSGLIWGIVAQLTGKDGCARFVAGWKQGDSCGATFDLSTIYTAPGDDDETARRSAGLAGDAMAERGADKERDHNRAWQAGCDWRDLKDTEHETRRALLALMAERRAARSMATGGGSQTICARLREMIETGIDEIRENREKRLTLWNGTPRALEPSFLDGADLVAYPA